jgi:RimJ/RimL family protein N-acetyltransferase
VTDRLVLRRPTAADVDAIVAVESDQDVAAATPEIGTTPDAVAAYVERQAAIEPFALGECFDLFLELRQSGALIGLVSLVHREPAQGQIGWALHGSQRGEGYATEAGVALTRYAFETLELHRVHADTSRTNVKSWRVMERIGLRREGVLREADRTGGRWQDVVLYGITVEDWLQDADGS